MLVGGLWWLVTSVLVVCNWLSRFLAGVDKKLREEYKDIDDYQDGQSEEIKLILGYRVRFEQEQREDDNEDRFTKEEDELFKWSDCKVVGAEINNFVNGFDDIDEVVGDLRVVREPECQQHRNRANHPMIDKLHPFGSSMISFFLSYFISNHLNKPKNHKEGKNYDGSYNIVVKFEATVHQKQGRVEN